MSSNYTVIGTGQTGEIKFFNANKGFGFIIPDDGSEDVFFHITRCLFSGVEPMKGDRVGYNVTRDKDRRRTYADQVTPL